MNERPGLNRVRHRNSEWYPRPPGAYRLGVALCSLVLLLTGCDSIRGLTKKFVLTKQDEVSPPGEDCLDIGDDDRRELDRIIRETHEFHIYTVPKQGGERGKEKKRVQQGEDISL